ncbi:MAG: hypothetical protein KDB68_02530 [Planctomycetes bacterium]|nr:hypothetical protein [Planctomycetota bacterium]
MTAIALGVAVLSLNPAAADDAPNVVKPTESAPAIQKKKISEAQAMSTALNHVTQSDAEVRVHNPRHDAVLSADGLTFTPWRAQEDWRWSLAEVRVGEGAVEFDPSVAPIAAQGVVRYDRGAITEQYVLKSRTIEQQFVLPAPLGVEGDLVIAGDVISSGAFSASENSWSWGDVSLGDVSVFDANGLPLDAHMNVSANRTTITVSGNALASAAYPVLIDPEIGTNDFRISDMQGSGTASFQTRHADVAYNATNNEYLVVWHGADVTDNVYDIYGQRINASTGAEVGTNDFRISNFGNATPATEDAFEPEVAWNSTSNEFLVVWEGRRGGDREIFGQFLSNTGAELGTDDFQISDMGGGATSPSSFIGISASVCFNSTNNLFLVAWHGNDDVNGLLSGETEVFGQLVDGSTRAPTGSDDFQISFMGGANGVTGAGSYDVLDWTATAYNATNNEFLVAWSADDDTGSSVDGEFEVYAQRLNASTGAASGSRIRVSDVGTDGQTATRGITPAAAWNSANNEYLVVFAGEDTGTDNEYEIWGQRIDGATGAEVGSNDFRISNLGTPGDPNIGEFDPKVAYNSNANEYFVVWWGDATTNNDNEIWGQRVSSTGTLTGSVEQLSQVGSGASTPGNFRGEFPDVAYASGSGEMLVVWNGDDNVTPLVDDEIEIFGQRWELPNTAPVINANGSGVSVTQGTTTSGATIATVSDAEDSNGSLTVMATSVPTGITVTGITNTSGTITANISATAAATPGANSVTLQVQDSGSATSTDTLTVTVIDDANPGITAGATVNVTEGTTVTGATIATVTDAEDTNGSLSVTTTSVPTGITVTGITNTSGTVTANVSATTAATLGSNTVVLQVQDSIGQTTTANLTVNVVDDTDPTITAAGTISVSQGGMSNGVTIATVGDTEDANGTLTVTATSVPTGISVTSITNTNGTITADVSATASATLGNNNVTLQVQDSLSQTTTDTLVVNVVVNSTPVITAAGAIAITQGASLTGVTIATVSDAEDADGSLTVTATSVPTGITVTNITNTNGTVTADISATIAATLGANAVTLQVQDSLTTASTDTLTVNVSAPTATGGGSDNDDEDCSTGEGSGVWMLMLAMLAVLGVVTRQRRAQR